MRNLLLRVFVLFVCPQALTSCSSPIGSYEMATVVPPDSWAVAWGASPENASLTAENTGGVEQTFRSFFYPTVAGSVERIRFSNYFGTSPVVIGAARLAIATTEPAVDPTADVALSFNGAPSITIAPGTEIMSDAVSLKYSFGQKMAVTAYVEGTFAPLTQHESQVNTNYSSTVNAGNKTADSSGTSLSQANTEWFLLSGMDVYGQYQGTVAIFGSSTIDGHSSNLGDTNAYPTAQVAVAGQDNDRISDALARTLNAAGYHLGVLNAGILGEVAGPSDGSSTEGADGVDRIGRDVLHQPGIKAVVIDLGQVDLRLGACGEATEVEASLQNMVGQASAAGVRVILGTIAPASYCTNASSPNYGYNPSNGGPFGGDSNPGPENPENVQRRLVNAWIRTTGSQLPGVVGVADFEAALADPEHPDFLIPTLNSGDNFHPDGQGYQVKSQAIPIQSLLAPAGN